MSKARDDWNELKPKIGIFVSELDYLLKGAENVDEIIEKAEERGYKKGFKEDKENICSSCYKNMYYNNCNGYYCAINKFLSLNEKHKSIILNLIDFLYDDEIERSDIYD